nr:proclotting enzyme-like [Procambarus clarkii]
MFGEARCVGRVLLVVMSVALTPGASQSATSDSPFASADTLPHTQDPEGFGRAGLHSKNTTFLDLLRPATEVGSLLREAEGVSLSTAAPERPGPGRESRARRSKERKGLVQLRPAWWRRIRPHDKQNTKKIRKKAVCGKTYYVTSRIKYKFAIGGRESCNIIFRGAAGAAFRVVCPKVMVPGCVLARLSLHTATHTTSYCSTSTSTQVDERDLTELLVSYKVLKNSDALKNNTWTACSVRGTSGDGYRAAGVQPCPLQCGSTTPDAEADPPPGASTRLPQRVKPKLSRRLPLEELTPQDSSWTRIQGGKDANIGEWPWVVYLKIKVSGSFVECGGSIISPLYVLTAAHCVFDVNKKKGDSVRVIASEYDLKDEMETDRQSVIVRRVRIYPRYDNVAQIGDIALLKLKRALVLGEGVAPACLAPPGNYEGDTVVLAGWGNLKFNGQSPEKLQEATQKVVNLDECARNYSTLPDSDEQPLTDEHVCTSAPGVDSCQGDSGGPVMLRKGSTWYQVGIVSYGHRCAEPGFPGVNTFVPSYISWILDTMEEQSCG